MLYHKSYHETIPVPPQVQVQRERHVLQFRGPLGTTQLNVASLDAQGQAVLSLDRDGASIAVATSSRAQLGLLSRSIRNKIQGVTQGFLVYLKIIGTGYRATLQDSTLAIKAGWSHDIVYKIPDSVRMFLLEPTLLCVFGIDKMQVSQIAANIRATRPPGAYKGKGIRRVSERVIVKAGKRK